MVAYRFFKVILGPLYRFWYNPKIIGKENIPKEGRFIIVGNHVHIMDQCNVVISTRRCLHYMAKKEYFDNKKVAWFFKSAGCIPVDRSKKDDDATSAAVEVLNNDNALGLFPEGTRNGLKEERIQELYTKYHTEEQTYEEFVNNIKKTKTSQINYLEELLENEMITKEEFLDNIFNVDEYLRILINERRITRSEYYSHMLLPLKFGAVSLAKKTNSQIIPFVITGDYKFRSKNLKVLIGEAIDPSEDLEAANKRLNDVMVEMIRENYENNGK